MKTKVKLLRDERISVRIHSSIKEALCKRAEETGENLPDLITRIALAELGSTENDFIKLALAS